MEERNRIIKVVLEILRYVISAVLGMLGGGVAASCI